MIYVLIHHNYWGPENTSDDPEARVLFASKSKEILENKITEINKLTKICNDILSKTVELAQKYHQTHWIDEYYKIYGDQTNDNNYHDYCNSKDYNQYINKHKKYNDEQKQILLIENNISMEEFNNFVGGLILTIEEVEEIN